MYGGQGPRWAGRDRRHAGDLGAECITANVDFPIDIVVYRRDGFEIIEHRYEKNDLIDISNWWQERLRESVRLLPSDWTSAAFPDHEGAGGGSTIPISSGGPL